MNSLLTKTVSPPSYFTSWDNTRLHYHSWLPSEPAHRAVIYCHRGHEHGARWKETARALDLAGCAHFAWDARGHGLSEGRPGDAPHVGALVRDLDRFVCHIAETHGIPQERIVVVGHSVGAVIVATWVHDYAPPIRGMILATPAFRVKLYVPLAIPQLRAREKLFGAGEVRSYVKPTFLTHDAEQVKAYREDAKIFPQISVRLLLDLHGTGKRVVADAAAITTPTLLLTAGSDWIVNNATAERFFGRLRSPRKVHRQFDGFYHSLFQEKERHLVVEETRTFLTCLFKETPAPVCLLNEDREGYTKRTYDRLCGRGFWGYPLMRSLIRGGASLSHGLRLGRDTGFDSGVTLDYVYKNQPCGKTPLGRMADRCYLNSVGWRCIRRRRRHIEDRLAGLLQEVSKKRGAAHILDIAAGGGRYLLETLQHLSDLKIEAFLQDYKEVNVEAARRLRDELGLTGVTVEKGDAFALDGSLPAGLRFHVAVASGIYELFPQNDPVRQSLQQVADRLEPGGYLLYTNQPWHPQLELIARLLHNREGQPWIMRCRTQAEMDQLVAAAGLVKTAMDIDEFGVCSVSVARKPE